MAEQIRVIVLKEDEFFIAQCLEIDVAAQGATQEEALSRLQVAINAEQKAAEENGTALEDIGAAPDAFRAVYDAEIVEKTALVA